MNVSKMEVYILIGGEMNILLKSKYDHYYTSICLSLIKACGITKTYLHKSQLKFGTHKISYISIIELQ